MIGVNGPYDDGEKNPNKVFDVTNNVIVFDRNGYSAGQSFFVQGQCTYINTLEAYTDFQKFKNNLYWRTDGTFASDQQVFYQQITANPNDNNDPCLKILSPNQDPPDVWRFYSFAQWQGLGEDRGSVVKDPHFIFPYFPFDDFRMAPGSPMPGFVPFDPNEAGRKSPTAFDPPPVAPTFMTAPFNPTTDF